jgi:hypothetical protein
MPPGPAFTVEPEKCRQIHQFKQPPFSWAHPNAFWFFGLSAATEAVMFTNRSNYQTVIK